MKTRAEKMNKKTIKNEKINDQSSNGKIKEGS